MILAASGRPQIGIPCQFCLPSQRALSQSLHFDPLLILRRSQSGAGPDKRSTAARPTHKLVMIMNCFPLDLLNLPDKQTIAVHIPSTGNQFARREFFCGAHSPDPTHIPCKSNSTLNGKPHPPPILKHPVLKPLHPEFLPFNGPCGSHFSSGSGSRQTRR